MDKNYLNKKWLEGSLTDEEQNAFDAINDNDLLKEIVDKAPAFKASNFSEAKDFETLQAKMNSEKNLNTKRNWFAPMLKIAGALVIGLGVYFLLFSNNAVNIETSIAEKRTVQLPDASQVILNAVSEIEYNEKTWEDKRELTLEGEAFFKVEKGATFDVITTIGKVTVLGTQFNVKQRKNFFEVSCFEGLVAVSYGNKTLKLRPGKVFRLVNNKMISDDITTQQKPSWINGSSYFKKVAFHEVFQELERQYNVEITVNQKDENLLFTGGFTHKNLEEALESITAPLKLVYVMESPTKISLRHSE